MLWCEPFCICPWTIWKRNQNTIFIDGGWKHVYAHLLGGMQMLHSLVHQGQALVGRLCTLWAERGGCSNVRTTSAREPLQATPNWAILRHVRRIDLLIVLLLLHLATLHGWDELLLSQCQVVQFLLMVKSEASSLAFELSGIVHSKFLLTSPTNWIVPETVVGTNACCDTAKSHQHTRWELLRVLGQNRQEESSPCKASCGPNYVGQIQSSTAPQWHGVTMFEVRWQGHKRCHQCDTILIWMFQLTSSKHPGAAKEKVVDAAFLVAPAKTSPHHKSHCSPHKSIMLKPLMKHASKGYSAWRVGVAHSRQSSWRSGWLWRQHGFCPQWWNPFVLVLYAALDLRTLRLKAGSLRMFSASLSSMGVTQLKLNHELSSAWADFMHSLMVLLVLLKNVLPWYLLIHGLLLLSGGRVGSLAGQSCLHVLQICIAVSYWWYLVGLETNIGVLWHVDLIGTFMEVFLKTHTIWRPTRLSPWPNWVSRGSSQSSVTVLHFSKGSRRPPWSLLYGWSCKMLPSRHFSTRRCRIEFLQRARWYVSTSAHYSAHYICSIL